MFNRPKGRLRPNLGTPKTCSRRMAIRPGDPSLSDRYAVVPGHGEVRGPATLLGVKRLPQRLATEIRYRLVS